VRDCYSGRAVLLRKRVFLPASLRQALRKYPAIVKYANLDSIFEILGRDLLN